MRFFLHKNTIWFSCFIISLFCLLFSERAFASDDMYTLHLNRVERKLYILNAEKSIVQQFPVNIGRGGIAAKKSMSDFVTPTGDFEVDLILYSNPSFDNITPKNLQRFQKNKNFDLIKNKEGLTKLFQNMNKLDFDGDGKPDQAYGKAYIGLTSNTAVTGPKLHQFHGIPYWFSIAFHGTPDDQILEKASSGGCVHLSAKTLEWLVTKNIVQLGTKVNIRDEDPKI